MDFSLTSFATPIAREKVARVVAEVAAPDVQLVPVQIPGHDEFFVLSCPRVLRCLDEDRSEYIKWTKQDHRPDFDGQYRSVPKLRIDSKRVPPNVHIFRIEGWNIALIVSEIVKSAMERCRTVGAKFVEAS